MERLKNKYSGQICTLVGKGPSLEFLTKEHFVDGPVIAINHAGISVEALELPNDIYIMQKDGGHKRRQFGNWANLIPDCDVSSECNDCEGIHKPKKAALLVHNRESLYCLLDYSPRHVMSWEVLGLSGNECSFIFAIQLAKLMGCVGFRFISFDAHTTGDTRTFLPGKGVDNQKTSYESTVPKIAGYIDGCSSEWITPTIKKAEKIKVSIIIPVIRPESAARCIKAINENAGVPRETFEIVSAQDHDRIGCPEMVKMLTGKTRHDLVMFLGDDTIPEAGFLKEAIEAMETLPDGWGVVGLNTEGPNPQSDRNGFPSDSNPIAHWIAHKKMLEHIPGGAFFSTEYRHSWGDNELYDIASELNRWGFAEKSRIGHDHPINGKGDWDNDLAGVYSSEAVEADYKTYMRRKRDRNVAKHGVRLAVGVPLTDLMVYSQFMFSFLRLEKLTMCELLMPNYPGQIDAVRNDLVRQALNLGCTHILFLDTDQIYLDEDMIQRMLDHQRPIVGAMVHRRYPPFDPLLLRGETGKLYSVPDEEIKPNGEFANLVPVDRTGSGCIMIDTSVFLELEYPWFELRQNPDGTPVGEDFAFCEKATAAGFEIFVDCSIRVQHLALMAVDWSAYQLYRKVKGGRKRNGE